MIRLDDNVKFTEAGKTLTGRVVGLIEDSRFGKTIMVKTEGFFHYVPVKKAKLLPD
jgi:hypothetical protein